ncbi:MAG: thiolase family protein [Alphaproteobacteria bacterium]|nr:thiolase family protein [Alphaproteobacteria bacterium]
MARGYDDIVVVVPTTEPYVRRSEHGAAWFIARVLGAMLRRSGLAKDAIDGLCLSSLTLAPDTAVAFTQHAGLSPRFLEWLPMGGASGVVALRRAARAVQAGDAEIVACIAGDTANATSFTDLIENFSSFSRDAVYPYGAGGPNASFALITDAYMRGFGATRADFGRLCVAQRANARRNPLALLREPLTLEAYLAARPIAEPLHLFDCVMPCAGAEGFLVMRRARAEALGLRGVRLLGAIERHNAYADDPVQMRGGWAIDREALWAQAGVAPDAINLVQVYDDYPVIAFMQLEDLGFCGKGGAAAFVRDRDLTVAGDFPVNTGGGQLSAGQAGAAGGYLGLVEAVRQLAGEAAGRAVPDARHALVSGFGMINYDRGLCTAACVLAAP